MSWYCCDSDFLPIRLDLVLFESSSLVFEVFQSKAPPFNVSVPLFSSLQKTATAQLACQFDRFSLQHISSTARAWLLSFAGRQKHTSYPATSEVSQKKKKKKRAVQRGLNIQVLDCHLHASVTNLCISLNIDLLCFLALFS